STQENITHRLRPAEKLISAVALSPQKRLVAEPSRLVEKHRRQTAAAVVIHSSPSLAAAFLRISPIRRNRYTALAPVSIDRAATWTTRRYSRSARRWDITISAKFGGPRRRRLHRGHGRYPQDALPNALAAAPGARAHSRDRLSASSSLRETPRGSTEPWK